MNLNLRTSTQTLCPKLRQPGTSTWTPLKPNFSYFHLYHTVTITQATFYSVNYSTVLIQVTNFGKLGGGVIYIFKKANNKRMIIGDSANSTPVLSAKEPTARTKLTLCSDIYPRLTYAL